MDGRQLVCWRLEPGGNGVWGSGIGREVGLNSPSGTFFLATMATKLCKRGRLSGSACVSFCCHLFGIFSGTLERGFVYIYVFTLCV